MEQNIIFSEIEDFWEFWKFKFILKLKRKIYLLIFIKFKKKPKNQKM